MTTPTTAPTTAPAIPTACPGCRSPAVTTAAKHPDDTSYWRCDRCGEIWNVGRRHEVVDYGRRWR